MITECLYISRCNHTHGSDYDIREDNKDGTSPLKKDHITLKRLQDVFEKQYTYERQQDSGAADNVRISCIY